MALGSCVGALGRMKGAEPLLVERLAQAKGLERKVLVLSLALQGRKDMRPEVVRMLRDEKDGYLRKMAADFLCTIGTPEDIPLLLGLAKSDPYSRPSVRDRLYPGETKLPDKCYPVREAAEQTIRYLRHRFREKR